MRRGTRRTKQTKRKTQPEIVKAVLTIDELGHRGDGVGHYEGKKVYIPYTLPGEQVDIALSGQRGTLVHLLSTSEDRNAPICDHFGDCGGCALQHVKPDAYLAWKQKQLNLALNAQHIDVVSENIHAIGPQSRRRAIFSARREGGCVVFGFQSAKSNRIIALSQCPVMVPAIPSSFRVLNEIARLATPARGLLKIYVLASDHGLDVRLDGVDQGAGSALERDLVHLARQARFARISLEETVLLETDKVTLSFGKARVKLPPGAFTQASEASQEFMITHVKNHLAGMHCVADLFAGCGTFALALADESHIHAVESDEAALFSLQSAARSTPGLKPVTVERRDLFRRPLLKKELLRFDAVVLDPPRAGAKEQVALLANSHVTKIAYISCAPASFARDARILLEGGYRLTHIFPVDQFLFSHHIELVGLFERER